MDQHQVGLGLDQHPFHTGEALAGNGGEGLPGFHNVEVIVRRQAEDVEHRVQHLTVLGGNTAQALHTLPARELLDQRRHLDGLRPGTEYGHDTDGLHG